MKISLLIVSLLASSQLIGQQVGDKYSQLKDTAGIVYIDATVVQIDPDGLIITHETGGCKIGFELLPVDIQKKYNYDQSKASEFKAKEIAKKEAATAASNEVKELAKKQAAEKAALAAKIAKAVRIKGRIIQATSSGLLVVVDPEEAPTSGGYSSIGGGGNMYFAPDPNGKGRPKKVEGTFWIVGHPSQAKKVDKDTIDIDAYEDGIYSYNTVRGAQSRIKKYNVVKAFQ